MRALLNFRACAVAISLVVHPHAGLSREAPTPIVESENRPLVARMPNRFGDRFDGTGGGQSVSSCTEGERSPTTIRQALGSPVRRLLVHDFDKEAWRDWQSVADYLSRVLDAGPENGALSPFQIYSEGVITTIRASVELASGELRLIEFAKGYVHVADARGCEWWGRYPAISIVPMSPGPPDLLPVEGTSAYRLLQLEATVRAVPAGALPLLHQVINDGSIAAAKTNPNPKSRTEALATLMAIQVALERHNFLQPIMRKDWPQTIGTALTPLNLTALQLADHLADPDNARRLPNLDRTKPMYWVDCDMGASLFLAIGERFGWNTRLVEVPSHNFVRWTLSTGETVNWDWTHGESRSDDAYHLDGELGQHQRLRGFFLRSYSPTEANAYYLGLVGSKATRDEDEIRLLEESIKAAPFIEVTQNNLAWAYATTPGTSRGKLQVAISAAMAALSVEPDNGNVADTLACSFAAVGEKNLALALEDYAIQHPGSGATNGYRENRKRISEGIICQ
jgi:hypothetical protein